MKISIKQKMLVSVLEKGAIAAISEEGQGDSSNLAPLIKAVKITVDKNFTVESSTNLIASKYSIPVAENEITVADEGVVLFPAKELMDWVKLQKSDALINMAFQASKPRIINEVEGETDKDIPVVKVIGSLKITSKDSIKTSGKWELDCYDVDSVKSVNYNAKSKKCFDIKGKQLADDLNSVLFASSAKDYQHKFDCISLQHHKGKVYVVATDTHRCAVSRIIPENITNVESTNALLIPSVLLQQAVKISEETNTLSFYHNQDKDNPRIFVSQPNLEMRLAASDENKVKEFPSVAVLIDKEFKPAAEISKDSLTKILMTASLVNKDAVLITIDKDDCSIVVKAISEESKYAPLLEKTGASEVLKNVKVVCSPSHIIDALKIIKADIIQVFVPDSMKSIKIIGKDDANFSYYAMTINTAKYNE